MKLLAGAYIAFAVVALFPAATETSLRGLGPVILGVGLVWLFAINRSRGATPTFFAVYAGLSGACAASGGGALLPGISIALALLGWDAALAATRLKDLTPSERGSIAVRYAASSVAVAAAGIGLVLAATWIRTRLTFGLAVGLAAAFLVLAFVIGLATRPPRIDPTANESCPNGAAANE